jgi:predicted metal-dependent HD superfamily phosphohydrolase
MEQFTMSKTVTLARWKSLWSDLGVAPPADEIYQRVINGYTEPHRKYHTLQHLDECLAHFDESRQLAAHPAEVELALWFHDVVYKKTGKDNEEKSADWLRMVARGQGLDEQSLKRLYDLVMVTKHDAVPQDQDARLLVDIDLGILGANPQRFDEYEQQVRKEYTHVPGFLYRSARRKVLNQFLSRRQIYSTDHFRQFEQQARENLARSLAALS